MFSLQNSIIKIFSDQPGAYSNQRKHLATVGQQVQLAANNCSQEHYTKTSQQQYDTQST